MQRHHALILTFVAGLLAGCTVPDNKFSAVGPNGQHVDGAVCCGAVAKACTIRLD